MLRRLTALLLTAVLLLSALTACGTKPVAEESGETDDSLAEETAPQEEETPAALRRCGRSFCTSAEPSNIRYPCA